MNSLAHSDDQELIGLYLNGNNNAFNVLLNRHKEKVFTSIQFLVKDSFLAEDLFQEVFIKVVQKLRADKYHEEGKFLPWVIRIARNLCMDHFRRLKTSPRIRTDVEFDTLANYNHRSDSYEEGLIQSEEYEYVKLMVDELPADQREVVILRHFANLSFKEIATITDCSINTALGRMRYGLINLRKLHENSKAA